MFVLFCFVLFFILFCFFLWLIRMTSLGLIVRGFLTRNSYMVFQVDCTVGSALDMFGGDLKYSDVLAWHNLLQINP
jgi:hypothetical protein